MGRGERQKKGNTEFAAVNFGEGGGNGLRGKGKF